MTMTDAQRLLLIRNGWKLIPCNGVFYVQELSGKCYAHADTICMAINHAVAGRGPGTDVRVSTYKSKGAPKRG